MNALIGLIALVVVALVGWAIAEFKYKAFTFTRSEKDIEEEKELEELKRADGFKEMNIREALRARHLGRQTLALLLARHVLLCSGYGAARGSGLRHQRGVHHVCPLDIHHTDSRGVPAEGYREAPQGSRAERADSCAGCISVDMERGAHRAVSLLLTTYRKT